VEFGIFSWVIGVVLKTIGPSATLRDQSFLKAIFECNTTALPDPTGLPA
jgi:hypothetical protein